MVNIFFAKLALKDDSTFQRKSRRVKKICWYVWLKFLVLAFILTWTTCKIRHHVFTSIGARIRRKDHWSRSPHHELSLNIFMTNNSSVRLFLKQKTIFSRFKNTIYCYKPCSEWSDLVLDTLRYPLAALVETPAEYNFHAFQCIINSFLLLYVAFNSK